MENWKVTYQIPESVSHCIDLVIYFCLLSDIIHRYPNG